MNNGAEPYLGALIITLAAELVLIRVLQLVLHGCGPGRVGPGVSATSALSKGVTAVLSASSSSNSTRQ